MERNIHNRDFEQYVKKNADQYRMYPSEKVWKGIYSTLHTRRRWYGIGLGLLLLSAVAVTWVMVNSSAPKEQVNIVQNSAPKQIKPEQQITPEQFINTTIQHNNQKENLFSKETLNNAEPLNNTIEIPIVQMPSSLNNDIENSVAAKTNTSKETVPQKSVTPESLNVLITDQETDNQSDLATISTKNSPNNFIPSATSHMDKYPLTIESVLNSYKAGNLVKKDKFGLQFFFTPTVSYRKLSENNSIQTASIANNPSSFASLYGINNVVTHKPDMGVEFGLTAGFPIAKNFKLIGGLQFNISRYGIKAYSTYGEIATVALNSGSVATWTNYRNFSGSNTNWLQNYYFSVSAPVGAEYRLFNGNKTQFGISATLQPSYILGDRAYLLTTDYKNYVEIPWLIRRWNLNTSIETFVSYSTGKIRWQVGPQVRYQVFSSFQNKYPVKENLFDFGLKVGIMLNK